MKDIFDYLENAMDDEINSIAEKTPKMSDEQINRLLKMSERKYNKRKNSEIVNEDYEIKAEGVDRYRRSLWNKYLPVAAVCLIAVIGITGVVMNMKRIPMNNGPVNIPPEILATVTTVSSASTGTETHSVTTSSTVYSDDKCLETTVTAASETTEQSIVVITTTTTAISQIKTTSAVTTAEPNAVETIEETGASENIAGVYSSKSGIITLYADGTGTISFQDTVSIRWNDRELIGDDFTYSYTISGNTITIDYDGMERSFTKGGEMPHNENQNEPVKVYFVPDYSDGLTASTEYNQQIAIEAEKVLDNIQTLAELFDYIDRDKIDMTDTFTITALQQDFTNVTEYERISTYARYVDSRFDSMQSIRYFINSWIAESNNYYEYNFSGSTYNGYNVPVITPGCKVDTIAPPTYCEYNGKLYRNIDYIDNNFVPVPVDNNPLIVKYYPDAERFNVMIPMKYKDGSHVYGDPDAPEMYVLEFIMAKQSDGLYKRENITDGMLNEYYDIVSSLE